MSIDLDSPDPLYEQVAAIIEARIKDGTYTKRIPPARALKDEFDLSLPTIQKAIGLLKERGVVVTRVGRGTFVAQSDEVDGGGDRPPEHPTTG
ncbi:hypothetical protein BJF79_23615 [Actinomadura sp. CNU-125]|uniref:GntR family transcriptional regulator n=1 Tax=Actinomadura sp. CNU-125 TaxID=1904961 RepID=UPI00096038B9|nr:GntR family transcriptional regulator [Actinomadura sp. CNU-125]OLT11713.1 hypothetical protein BJF79_23615 [Actinomadura sp. CNU-125]